MSVIRLSSENRVQLADACGHILEVWKNYSDENAGIFSHTDGIPHNTITPIARICNSGFECDLVLRNNLTSDERPLGIFHPNPSLHHIKKENIGLIEVMGLAVLPSRLAKELDVLKKSMILHEIPENSSHAEWAKKILEEYPDFNSENADSIIKSEVGKVFEQVLCDCGVFKDTESGKKYFDKFIDKISE